MESHSKIMIGISVGLFLVILVVVLYLSFKAPPQVVVLANSPNSASMFNIKTPNGFSIGVDKDSGSIVLCDPDNDYMVTQEWFIKFNRMLIASSIITQDGLPITAPQQQLNNTTFTLENFTNASPTYFDFEFISKGKYTIAEVVTPTTPPAPPAPKTYIAPATGDVVGSVLTRSPTPFTWSIEIAPQVAPQEKQKPPSPTGNTPDSKITYTISTTPVGSTDATFMTGSAIDPPSGSQVTLSAGTGTGTGTQLWYFIKGNIVPATSQNSKGIDPSPSIATSGPATIANAVPSTAGPFTFVAAGSPGAYQILTQPQTVAGVSISKQLIPSAGVVNSQLLSNTDIPYIWQLTVSSTVSGLEYQHPKHVSGLEYQHPNQHLYSCGGCCSK